MSHNDVISVSQRKRRKSQNYSRQSVTKYPHSYQLPVHQRRQNDVTWTTWTERSYHWSL